MTSSVTPSACGRCLYTLIIFVATMSLLMTTIVHIFAWYQEDIEALPNFNEEKLDWFKAPRALKWVDVGCMMEVWWTFWMWIAVFFLQLIWIFYGMVLTCRRSKSVFLYELAATMPCTVYLTFLIGLGATAAWNVFWGESGLVRPTDAKWGALVLGAASLLFHLALAIAVQAFIKSISDLRSLNKPHDLLWNQLFTHNGLAAMAAWTAVVTVYAFSAVLASRELFPGDADTGAPRSACAIGLGLIMFYMLVWFLADLLFTGKALYYVFTPYVVVIIVFVSALVGNMAMLQAGEAMGSVHENVSLVVSAVFLSVTALFFVVKVLTVIIRGRYSTSDVDDVRSLHDDNVYVMQ